MAETGPLPQPSAPLILLWGHAPHGGEKRAGKGCPTDSSSPGAPQVDVHSLESREDRSVCPTQEFRNPEVLRGPEVQPSGLLPRAAFASELCFQPCALPGPCLAVRHRAKGLERNQRCLEVASRPPGGSRFFLSGEGKSHSPVCFPSRGGRGAWHMDTSRSASVSSVAFSVDGCVCMCVCVCEAQALGTNVHLLNLTIKSYSGAAKIGTGWGRKAKRVGESWSLKRLCQSAWPRY